MDKLNYLELKKSFRNFIDNDVMNLENEIKQKHDLIVTSNEYKSYMRKIIILFVVMIFCFFIPIFLPIGLLCFVLIFLKLIFMPAKLKQEAKDINARNEIMAEEFQNNPSAAINSLMFDTQVKNLLMEKFLSIFGDFSWTKDHSFFDTTNLVILPDKLSFDTDDCVAGLFNGVKIKLTEVYFGFNALLRFGKAHSKRLSIFTTILFLFFFIVFASALFGLSEKLLGTMFAGYIVFFFVVWSLGFFSPFIFLIMYLFNKKSRGLIIEIDMPKNFAGETIIFEKSLSNFVINKSKLKNFHTTSLEDVEFNSNYYVYTNNEIESRYVLTTAFIERLKNINFCFNAKYLRMLFRNNRITIFAQVQNDLFSMVKNDKTDIDVFENLFKEMYSVLSLVETLKLNIKTGL